MSTQQQYPELNEETPIIEGASYFSTDRSYKKSDPVEYAPRGFDPRSKTITFYTHNGDKIVTFSYSHNFWIIESKLDPNAPNPKVSSFKRIWWPAISIAYGVKKGAPGYAVLFHDKNDNRIGWARLNTAEDPVISATMDLTTAFEERSDFSLKPTDDNLHAGCTIL